MNKADFTDLLKNPEKLGTEHIETLRKIVADFPFFSTAHVLLAKALANTNHYEYEKQLKITALLTGDRAVLHQFITGNKDQEGDIEAFNVPLELKVEKVSKPDFEITEAEAQEAALLNQANSLLAEAETTFNNEVTAEEEKETVETATNNVDGDSTIFNTEDVVAVDYTNQSEIRGGNVLDTNETVANENTEEVVNVTETVEQDAQPVDENTALSDVPDETLTDTKEAEDDITVENREEVNQEFVEEFAQAEETKQPVESVDEVKEVKEEETYQHINELVELVRETDDVLVPEENDNNGVSSASEQSSDTLVSVELNNNTKEKVYQLAETEGTLVRFKGNFSEEILQDFDETSFEDNKENIETVTKSITPIAIVPKEEPAFSVPDTAPEEDKSQNDLLQTGHEEQQDGIFSDIIITEKILLEEHIDIQETNVAVDKHVIELIEEEKPTYTEQPVFAVEPVIPVSLDELLEKYNDVLDEEPPFIMEELITESKQEEEFETLPKEEIAETVNTAHNTVNEEGLSFIDWLNKNKKESNQNTESKVDAKTNTSAEDDEFTLYIQHLIKTKAESTLAKNIEAEIQFEPTDLQEEKEELVAENIVSAIELPDVDPRLIDEEEEEIAEVNDTSPVSNPFIVGPSETYLVVDKTESDEDSTFEEIEAFEVNNTKEEAKEEKETVVDVVSTPFIEEIYSGKVESILPDFEKLNAKNSEQDLHDSFFTFDESKDLAVVENNTNSYTDDESDIIKVVSFETAALNEDLFENSFMQIFPNANHLAALNNQQKEPAIKTPPPKMEVESILEKFMRENPSITRPKAEFFNPVNVAKLSIEEKDEIVSETLASIYLKQGLVKKAISTYEKLSLIYPHKIAYFAALIKQLKTEHNIN